MRAHRNRHFPDQRTFHRNDVLGFDRANAFRRAGVKDVAGIKRVEGGGEFDEATNPINQLSFVVVFCLISPFTLEEQRHVVRIGDFIGGHHPRTENGISIA